MIAHIMAAPGVAVILWLWLIVPISVAITAIDAICENKSNAKRAAERKARILRDEEVKRRREQGSR